MKKNIINIFLAVAIALMTILFYNCIVGAFKPIRTETQYTRLERGRPPFSDRTYTYIFHSDGTFDEIVVQGGTEEKGYGMYVVDGDRIRIFFIMGPSWQQEKFPMQIQDGGASLKWDSEVYEAGFNMGVLYLILTGICETALIIAVFVINKKCS